MAESKEEPTKAYLITNPSGNTASVTKEMFEELKEKEGYKGEVKEIKSTSTKSKSTAKK